MPATLRVIDRPEPARTDQRVPVPLPATAHHRIGPDCDRSVVAMHNALLMAQTRRMALEARLAALGIHIDAETGAVRMKSR